MGRSKKLRKKLAGLKKDSDKHREKIAAESRKAQPDWDLIAHWEREIAVSLAKQTKVERSLKRERKR
jgi:hypothetical protein